MPAARFPAGSTKETDFFIIIVFFFNFVSSSSSSSYFCHCPVRSRCSSDRDILVIVGCEFLTALRNPIPGKVVDVDCLSTTEHGTVEPCGRNGTKMRHFHGSAPLRTPRTTRHGFFVPHSPHPHARTVAARDDTPPTQGHTPSPVGCHQMPLRTRYLCPTMDMDP